MLNRKRSRALVFFAVAVAFAPAALRADAGRCPYEGYDPARALAIPNEELARLGVSHSLVTGAQASLYKAASRTGAALTWADVAKIETKALVRGGMNLDTARSTVDKAIKALQDAGVSGPTRIPWGGK